MASYDEMFDEEAAGQPAANSAPSAYDKLFDQEVRQKQAQARSVIELALKDDPEIAAERQRLSKTAGLPLRVIERNLDEVRVKEQARAIDLLKMAQDSPVLARQLVDPNFTTVAIDDLPVLSQIEKSVGNAVRYMMGAAPGGGLPGDLPRAATDVALGATAGLGEMIFNVAGAVNDVLGLDTLAGAARGSANRSRQARQGFGLQPESATGQTVKDALGSSGTNLAVMPLGLARGLFATSSAAGSAVAGVMGAGVAADAYLQAREKGKTGVESALFGIPQGVFEYVFEKIPASKLFGDIAANTSLMQTLRTQALSEGWTEQLTTLAQDFNEWMNLNPSKTAAEFLAERPEAAYQTLIATLVGVGVQTTTIRGIDKAIQKASDRRLEFQQEAFADILKAAGTSALRQRSPEQFRAFVQAAVASNESAPQSVYVDAEVLNQLPEEVLNQLPESVRQQIPDELAKNGAVEIAMADVLTVAPGTPLEQVLNDNARMTPEGLSRADAVAAGDKAEVLRQEAERVIQQAADQEVARAEYETVRSLYADQIAATGRYRPAVAQQMGDWIASFYTAYGSRVGMTASQFQQRYPLRVAGAPSSQQTQVLNEGTRPGALDVEGYHFSTEARGTLSTAYYGTGLKGSARDEILSYPDKRISKRLSFYVDKGTGIRPESGVGGVAHRVKLSNIYDANTDPLKLRGGSAREFETRVLDAGFTGYLDRLDGDQPGQVVVLGDQAFTPEVLGPRSKIDTGERVPALQMREAPWQTQASGTPEQLQARLERMQASPAWRDYDLRVEGDQLQVRKKGGVFEQSVSSRVPWGKPRGKNAPPVENPLTERLQVGIEAFKDVPDALDNAVALLTTYPNYRPAWRLRSTESKVERFIAEVKANLLWLHDQVPAEIRQRSKLWYDGANVIANQFTERYDVSLSQASAILAVNSPQTEWFTNVSRAERILDIWTNQQDFRWSDEMEATASEILVKYPDELDEIRGKTLGELSGDSTLQAMWLRTFDQAHNDRAHRIVTPEGTFGDWVVNNDGVTKTKTAWASFGHIAKSIEVIRDGSIENVSLRLGNEHKVRSFYNNIFSPTDPVGDVTIDTHAVAAGLLRPLAGSDIEVVHNLGGGVSNALKGLSGTYGIYAEAYRQAAAERGILPREMQSITWEAVRGLYTDTFKSSAKAEEVEQAWRDFRAGRLDEAGVRARVLELSGGINEPNWWQSDRRPPTETWSSSYGGELSPVRVRGDAADAGAAGDPAGSGERGGAGELLNQGDLSGQTGNRGGRYSSGGLAPLEGAPTVAGATGPDPRLVAVAEQYAADNGIDLRRASEYVKVDPSRAARIAQAYEEMKHAPSDPAVRAAYDDLLRQVMGQYQALAAAGYQFTFFDSTSDPYAGNPWNAMRDLRANQRMAVYGTYDGFGTGGQVNIGLADPNGGTNLDPAIVLEALKVVGAEVQASAVYSSDTEPTLVIKVKKALTKYQGDLLSTVLDQEAIAQRTDDEKGALFGPMAEKWGPFNPTYFVTAEGQRADTVANPMLQDTGMEWPDQNGVMRPVTANDLFRAVHDAFGHGLEGAGFRAQGEENAWQAHRAMFTGPALGALTTETRGQNSWLNYGPHGEKNQTAKVEDTVFAEQKTGLMPEWTWNEGVVGEQQETLEQGPRGTFNPATLELVLNPNANLSTFFHETGHFFLEVMADIASQPNAPAQIVGDMGTFLKWAGVKDVATWNAMTLDQKRKYHERWAKSVEQYVMGGKAPSVELQPLMRRFATWLKSVYGSIKQMLAGETDAEQTPLNDDIRRVMDRMLATDEQIAQANEVAGLLPNEEADGTAAERLNKRSMRDLALSVKARDRAIADLRKEAKALEKAIREAVTVEVDSTPEMRAKRALDALSVSPEYAGMLAEHKAARKAAEATVRGEVKAALLADNPDAKGLIKGQLLAKNKRDIDNKVDAAMIKWDAANPTPKRPINATDADVATIADSFGFESVDAMLQAIDAFGPRQVAIDGITDQRMLEEHGDLVDERAIAEAANEAVHNAARARSLATELRTQAEMLNKREDTGETNAKGSKITVNALVEAAKQFAANVVGKTTLRDLKGKAWQHTAAERRAGAAWQKATAAGKTADAVKAKQDQVLNNAAAKAAIDAQAEAKKIFEFFRRVTKGNDETVVEKGRDADIVNAARAVLAAYGVESSASKGAAEYLEALAKNDPETFNVVKPMVDGATQNAQPLEALTFDELQALHEEIQAMWFLAKRSRQMEVDGDLLDVEEVADEVYARLEEIGIPDTIPGETGALTRAELLARQWLQQGPALLRRVEQWAEAKDGKFGGPFLRFIFQPVKDAADRYRTDRLAYRQKFQALVDNVAPTFTNGTIAAPELGYTFGRGHNGIGHAELLHALLHTGNESNKRKLLIGRGWASDNGDGTMDTSRWDAFIKRMADTGVLQPAHYDFAQGVWDLMEQTKPLAQKTHRDVFGRYFAEVTADAFVDPWGQSRSGGYVPAQADPLLVQDADLRELLETENAGMAQAFPATNKGFTKARVEYNRPLKLDLRTLPQHIDKVLLFSHMEPAVRGVAKLLRQKKVSQPLARVDPAAMGGMLKPWLNRSARQTVETPISADAGLNRMASTVRGRVGMALMFANVSNTLQQITGALTAAIKVKPSLMRRAAAQYIANPKKLKESVWALSPYMADRASNEVAVLSDTLEAILINPSVYAKAEHWTRRHGYFLQTALDNQMSPIIWTAAYNQGVAEGMDERMAIRYADGVIRQTQGSTLPEDVSRIETGPAYARLFTQFIGYFNMMANTNGTAVQQIMAEQGLKKGAGKAAGVLLLGLLAPIWVAEAIAHAMRGGPEDEDDDGYLDDWLAAVFGFGTIRGLLAGVPFIGAAAQSVVNRFNDQPADDKFSLSPTVSVLESAAGAPASVYKAIVDDASAQKAVRDMSALITVMTGLPAMAVARPVGYLTGVADDKIEPTSVGDAARGVITGTASPDSKQR